MTEPLRIDDALADLDNKVAALERGLVQYQQGVSSWTHDAMIRVTKSAGSVDSQGKEIAHRESLIHKDRADVERLHSEAVELKKTCENRERELNELAELLAQAQRDAAAKDKKLGAELERRQKELEAAETSFSTRSAKADSLQESLDKRVQEIELEAKRQQESRIQWQRECADQQAKLDAQAKALKHQSAALDEKSGNFEKESVQLRALAQQFDERKSQQERREAELGSREADLVDRERALSETQAAHGDRECWLDEFRLQLEAERAESGKWKERLELLQAQLDRQAQEQTSRDRELVAQSEQLARQKAQVEKERVAAVELEARCQAQEKSLEADRSNFAKEKIALENQREQLRTLESSLQADRASLAAAREAFDAQSAATQLQLAHEQDQLQVKLEQARQHESDLHNERTAMERLKEEFDRRIAQAGDREAELVAQQSKLESAIANIQNDRLTVQKARSMADEVAQARSDELAKSRQESDALRAEIAELRHSQDDLQQVLREARDAAQRETAAAETARRELQLATAQAESSQVAATESALSEYQQQLQRAEGAIAEIRSELEATRGQRSQLENDLLNALESREQAALKLDETRVELEQVGKRMEEERAQWAAQMEALKERQSESRLALQNAAPVSATSDDAGFPADAEFASHAGVGAFWSSMLASGRYAEQVASLDAMTNAQAAPPVAESSPPPERGELNVDAPADDMAGAIQAALAAAQAEINENHAIESSQIKQRSRAGSKRAKATVPTPSKEPAKLAKPAVNVPDVPVPPSSEAAAQENADPFEIPVELDAETRQKLKTLKRLDPNKSERELLAAICAENAKPAKPKAKRGWFSMK